jgi:hypothetical protein
LEWLGWGTSRSLRTDKFIGGRCRCVQHCSRYLGHFSAHSEGDDNSGITQYKVAGGIHVLHWILVGLISAFYLSPVSNIQGSQGLIFVLLE